MEPVTHLLTGGCLARAGLNRTTAYATGTMVLAAEFPDVDTLWGLRGPVELFQHHRGITHTFLGLPFEAALIVAGVYVWHRFGPRKRSKASQPSSNQRPHVPAREIGYQRNVTAVRSQPLPVRWGVLYGLALIALLSHLLLDYTNNYGLRPFFPFVDRWYAASIVFIFDPLIFALLLAALTLPWLFDLVGREVGAKRQRFPARGWAIGALLGVIAWWGLREVEHARALSMAMAQSVASPVQDDSTRPAVQAAGRDRSHPQAAEVPQYLEPRRALASPDPMSPFRWSAVMDFGPVYQLAQIDTGGAGSLTMGQTTYPKPGSSLAVLEAERSRLGKVYMDWSPMPIIDVMRPESRMPGDAQVVVTFRDPRFMDGWSSGQSGSGLEGVVRMSHDGRVIGETMGGRVERHF